MNSVAHPFLDRLFAAGPRLTLSVFVGIVVAVALPDSLEFRLTTRLLLAWDCGALTYLSLVFFMMRHADVNEIKRRAAIYDEGGLRFLILAVLGVAASFVAIFAELAHTRGMVSREIGSITLAAMTVILSWSLTHVMFALHYAHLYYHGGHEKSGGILMPENEEPDYSDFIYFSFVIGCASQTADISSTTRAMRRAMTVHGVVSFFFNAAILAMTINIAASLA
jgi:uncharacterized membrane protein